MSETNHGWECRCPECAARRRVYEDAMALARVSGHGAGCGCLRCKLERRVLDVAIGYVKATGVAFCDMDQAVAAKLAADRMEAAALDLYILRTDAEPELAGMTWETWMRRVDPEFVPPEPLPAPPTPAPVRQPRKFAVDPGAPTPSQRKARRLAHDQAQQERDKRNAQIRKLRASGWTYDKLAAKFGLSRTMIMLIIKAGDAPSAGRSTRQRD